MINGFEKETEELSEIERSLVPFVVAALKEKKGKEAAINNAELSREALLLYRAVNPGKPPELPAPRLRKIIHAIRCEELLPLLCANNKGYYIAGSREEASQFIESLRQRKSSLEELTAHLSIQFSRIYSSVQTKLNL